MKKQIKTPPSGRAPMFTMRLDPAIKAALDKAAKAEDRSAAYILKRIASDWLREQGFLK